MTRVVLTLAPWTRPLLALVLPHGLTDLSKPGVVGRYACWLALPLPPAVTTWLFCVASWVHLAHDVGGLSGSLCVHGLVHEVYRLMGPQMAFNAFLVYFAVLHTPLHYLTESLRGDAPLVCACLATTVVLLGLSARWHTFALTDELQKLVVAHVLTVELARRAHAQSDPSFA